MLALARQIVSGEKTDADGDSVEQVFAQARDAEASAEEFLVDDDWKAVESGPELEPVVVEVNGNGVNGDGHHPNGDGFDIIGPTVELAVGSNAPANGNGNSDGHAAVPANGNGHHEEPAEGQQSLFSWAEFLAEEPGKPKGHNRKPQPAAASLFDWALEQEQEREKEPVGAGR